MDDLTVSSQDALPEHSVVLSEHVVASPGSLVVQSENHDANDLYAPIKASVRLARLSLQMAGSYTFSFEMIVLAFTLGRINNSQDNLAAVALISSMLNTIVYIGATPLFSISIIVAEELGAYRLSEKNNTDEFLLNAESAREHLGAIYRHSVLMASAIIVPMVASLVFSQAILESFQQDPAVARITQQFLWRFALSMPAFMLRMCSEQIMYGFGKPKIVMQIGLTSFLLTVPLGIALAFGAAGLPKLGNWGLLIGCISESYLASSVLFAYLASSKQFQPFKFFNFLRPWTEYAYQRQKIGSLGGFILLTSLSETIGMLINSTLAGIVGVEEQAAFSLCSQFTLITFLLQVACGQTCSQEMNRALGQRQYDKVSLLGKSGLVGSVALVAPIPLLFAICPNLLMETLGSKDPRIQTILNTLVPIMAAATMIDLARYNLLQQLLILKDVNRPAMISTGSLAFGIVLSIILGLKTNLGIYGIASGYAVGVSLATISLLVRWVSRIQPDAIKQLCEPQDHLNINTPQTNYCCSSFFQRSAIKAKTPEDDVANPIHGSIAMVEV